MKPRKVAQMKWLRLLIFVNKKGYKHVDLVCCGLFSFGFVDVVVW